ncbi:hypothetical protein C6P97_13065 [Burkholderia multivorans]|uniref:Uncharacterized protein n=1 Tax=Burkholderia multivorans TaxID=87883 RepID=A0AB37AX67_9BURK|nr:hypothetical protein C6P97_13065 [Burkholderia multivorans]PRE51702.1 hypothetical protein C6P99_09420 [Burkholderia multivorans]
MSPVDRRARRFDAKHVVIASRGAIPRVVFSIVRPRRLRCMACRTSAYGATPQSPPCRSRPSHGAERDR